MTPKVDRADGWPRNQWHPAYTSLKEWLNDEAPEDDTPARRPRNERRARLIRRR